MLCARGADKLCIIPYEVRRDYRTPAVGLARFRARGTSFECVEELACHKDEAEGRADAYA